MKEFNMEAPIVMESNEDIAEALREIADLIDAGFERGFIPGKYQLDEWTVDELPTT